MSKMSKCFLRCVKDSHAPILLPHSQDVVLGRCPETKIVDLRCSKTQLTFRADVNNLSVNVKQTGANLSALNGLPLRKNLEKTAHHGDTVQFLLGQYEHVFEFQPAPKSLTAPFKRSLDSEEIIDSKKHCGSSTSPSENSDASGHVKKAEKSLWHTVESGRLLVYECQGTSPSRKIAAYDMDGTLILTKSGKVFPQYPDDWKIIWPEIPLKLQKLHQDGYKIVIFTNQAGISRGKTTAKEIQQKIEKIIAALKVPMQAFVATGDTIFRKPAPGMWDILLKEWNGGLDVDMATSFYCGDAAGRPENWAPKKKKDFSPSDRLFAKNLGLRFFTPEEHFLGQTPGPANLPDFDPSAMPKADAPLVDPPGSFVVSSNQELLLLVGFPGSGKSFYCREYILPAGYSHINRDTLGSWQKCVSATKSALEAGKSVVVDNTNPDPESRIRFVEVASKLNVPCRCAIVGDSIARARHNNKFRELIGETHDPISEMIMNSHKSKYKAPQLSEGYTEIIKVNFKPKFKKKEHERLYKMYLLDKY
ncbi:Bifunctional polynucleotide phosphatase/kinase [Frankliniella fusca]|uniref:Bifunctional polynucleotide phosphatase/kinase n=1 Tax=Frankliniella fusca TaxID=407009 RepID=A0AAE1LXK0_9NEOP|nr:Bifunctional polynucleotide phosphatase/kinase [Frankliniella fusca]